MADGTIRKNGESVEHDLKVWPEYWLDLQSGKKSFEVRLNDRDYRAGDTLLLRAWEPMLGFYMGDEMRKRVTYVLPGGQFGVADGYCVMAIEPIKPREGPNG